MSHHRWQARAGRLPGIVVCAIALAACTSTGVGGGEVVRGGVQEAPVHFMWTSRDGGVSGTMTADLGNETYEGRFFQITQQTDRTSLGPLWTGWRVGWYDWPYGGFGPYPIDDGSQFITHYTGRVVVNLGAPDGKRMRCRLQLVKPARGMSGGGEGECQLTDGRVVQARF